MAKQSKQFNLGDQPEWAGREPNENLPLSFIDKLLNEDPADSLINRGYCVIKLESKITNYYSKFHTLIEQFFSLSQSEKEKYAFLQFEPNNNSPNQCHGYSQVSNLKEQFMMRCIGKISSDQENDFKYTFPDCGDGNFGKYGMQIYQLLDLKARQLAKQCMVKIGKSPKCVDDILDPININTDNDSNSHSLFMPNGYISSSIMDNFHYYPANDDKHKKFYNNHASHTDSGLITCVITTDEPGLEIKDQILSKWIPIEQLIQNYLKEKGEYDMDKLCHRRYATFFWSDSCEYLNNAPIDKEPEFEPKERNTYKLKPLFHRVADCQHERFSVVFKQRTAPLRTHCRYQEDYILASIQQKVDTQSKNAYALWKDERRGKIEDENGNNNLWLYGSIGLLGLASICLYTYKK